MKIALIPARGGSLRIPKKNIRPFRGRPIIEYSIECARQSGLFDQIWVSTDDNAIEAVARSNGCEVYRRPRDHGARGTQDVAREVLLTLPQVQECCVIYATCPLLVPHDLVRCIGMLDRSDALYAMTVQTEPLADAGAVYAGQSWAFLNREPLISEHTVMIPMPNERVCDINTEADWLRAEQLYDAMHK